VGGLGGKPSVGELGEEVHREVGETLLACERLDLGLVSVVHHDDLDHPRDEPTVADPLICWRANELEAHRNHDMPARA